MKKRRHIPVRWIRKMFARQRRMTSIGNLLSFCAVENCQVVLTPLSETPVNYIIEHIVPRALLPAEKKDQLKNLELRCIPHAREKTNGQKAKATARGTDAYEIKKASRVRRKRKKARTRKYPWISRPLKGRGFSKQHRPMRAR